LRSNHQNTFKIILSRFPISGGLTLE
jgi:hypothetical protein